MTPEERIDALSRELTAVSDRYNRLLARESEVNRRGREAEALKLRAAGFTAAAFDGLDALALRVALRSPEVADEVRRTTLHLRRQCLLAGLAPADCPDCPGAPNRPDPRHAPGCPLHRSPALS